VANNTPVGYLEILLFSHPSSSCLTNEFTWLLILYFSQNYSSSKGLVGFLLYIFLATNPREVAFSYKLQNRV
jgi:hypothetical protein